MPARRVGTIAMVLFGLGLAMPPVHATGFTTTISHSAGRRTPLPLRDGIQVPEGKVLVSLAYTVSSPGASGEGQVTIYRTTKTTIGHLGVVTAEIGEGAVKEGQKPFEGLRIQQVETDSAAFKAGLYAGDVLLAADGVRLSNPREFSFLIKYHDLGRPVVLKVQRGDQVQEHSIPLGRQDVMDTDLDTHRIPALADHHAGLVLGDLTDALRSLFCAPGEGGVVVLEVRPGAPAFYSELRAADLVVAVSGSPTSTPAELDSRLGGAVGSEVELQVRRGLETRAISIEPVRRLSEGFSFKIPLVMSIRKSLPETDYSLVLGLVGHYGRESFVDASGDHEQKRAWGLVLNLIHYQSKQGARTFSLLWFIKWRW